MSHRGPFIDRRFVCHPPFLRFPDGRRHARRVAVSGTSVTSDDRVERSVGVIGQLAAGIGIPLALGLWLLLMGRDQACRCDGWQRGLEDGMILRSFQLLGVPV